MKSLALAGYLFGIGIGVGASQAAFSQACCGQPKPKPKVCCNVNTEKLHLLVGVSQIQHKFEPTVDTGAFIQAVFSPIPVLDLTAGAATYCDHNEYRIGLGIRW